MAERGKEERAPAVGDDGVFEIDRVVDIMWTHEEDDAPQYRVRWKGFPPIEDTWEPIENFTTNTRRTVREFVRHYTKLQMKESRFQREIGQGNGKLCRHVNILSREVLTISSMRCDTTRQPPLWFYLVVWRNERPEDATWESEVYLRHAEDLIHQYRAKHPTSPSTTLDCASRSPRGMVLPATTSQKLFLDGPAPRKQKEKIAFVDNLIDDSVILGQAKGGKGTQPKKRQVSCPSRQVDDKCKEVHKFEDILGKSKIAVNKGAKAIKHSPSNTRGTNEESKRLSVTVDGLTDDAITNMVPGHLKVGKSHSTSARHTKQQTGASTSRSNLNCVERDGSAEIQQKRNLATGEIEAQVTGSGDRFKRIVIASDTSESSDDDPSNDDINFYKTKFIRDEKLEEKKRRIRLMKNRKETDVVKTTKKKLTLNGKGKTPGSKENLPYERPFTEKDQLCKTKLSNLTTATNEKKSKCWMLKQPIRTDNKKDYYLKSKSGTKSMYEENHAVHRQRILEKFGNIFGYDTDSEDLTLSPESYCSSVERCSPLNTSGIRRLSLSGDCSPSSSVSSQSHVHGDDEYTKGISTATNAKEQSIYTSFNNICRGDNNNNNSYKSSNSSNYNIRRRRSSDGYKNSFHSEQQSSGTSPPGDRISGGKSLSNINSGSGLTSKKDSVSQFNVKRDLSFPSTSLLAGLKDYIPLSSTEISVQPEIVPQFYEDNLLAAVNQGDCDALLQLLSLPDISLPSLPFLSLLAGAIQAGRSGVAQVLAALSWGVDPPASHNQDQWGRVVEAAAVKGDLSLLLVLSTMSRDSTTRAPSTLSRGLQLCAHGGAQRCAQQHVLAALNTSRLSF